MKLHITLYYFDILWRIHPLLGKDLETNNETTAIGIKRRGKHPTTTIELLLETVFSVWSVQSGCKEDNLGEPVQLSSAREAEKRWCYNEVDSSLVEC
jgi:hypothetical protein